MLTIGTPARTTRTPQLTGTVAGFDRGRVELEILCRECGGEGSSQCRICNGTNGEILTLSHWQLEPANVDAER